MKDGNRKSVDVFSILNTLGYTDILSSDWYRRIDSWREWYEGKTKFHQYTVYNGIKMVGCTRQSLGMAKKICEDKADLLLNEKVSIVTDEQDYLDEVLDENNFWVRGNQLIELANALGTGAFVEYFDGQPRIDYVPATCVYPLSWLNNRITECAFAGVRNTGKDGEQTYINRHVLENGKYVVYNSFYDKNGKEVPLPAGVVPVWRTGSNRPLFQIITPNIVNNIAPYNPMRISIYANNLDALQTIDLIYDSYHNEFLLGKKRIFVDGSIIKVDFQSGEPVPIFDPNELVFHSLPGQQEAGKKPITESNMELRTADHQTALQTMLDVLSENVGFGKGYYKFDVDNVQTATAVISQNSKLYRKIRKDEIVLEKALIDMVRALLFLGGKNAEAEISVSFDDSIIEDTDAIAKRALLELQSGIIDNVEYYKRVYGLEEEAAKKLAKDIAARAPAPADTDFFDAGDGGSNTSPMAGGGAPVDAAEVKEAAQQATGERLNGAQVKSLMEIIAQYSAQAISESAAVNLIISAFGMSEAEARKLLGLGEAV